MARAIINSNSHPMEEAAHTVYLSLGTNLGDKEQNLLRAIMEIGKQAGAVVRRSAFHVTAPWGFDSSNTFLNACVCISTTLSPRRLLEVCQSIERQMGRRHKTRDGQYHDRIIDIDILLYDHLTVAEPDLRIPHPLMREREFVMLPLREILEEDPLADSDEGE